MIKARLDLFIQTEDTPNPNSLKFLPGRVVLDNQDALHFNKIEDCEHAPLPKRLLEIRGVVAVMLGSDFITVTKEVDYEWYVLKPSILGLIMEHFVNHLPIIISPMHSAHENATLDVDLSPIEREIKEILDTRVRPAVAQDGGDIVFDSFQDGVVYLRMHGACSGCPSSSATLKSGIENMLKYYVPEVLEVRQVES